MNEASRAGLRSLTLVVVCLVGSAGCSIRSMAVNAIVPTLGNPAVYLSEEDPELVREALPFLLKTIESLLETTPDHLEALLFACMGFTLYANAFVEADASRAEWEDYALAAELETRAGRLYVRARDYCLRRVEIDHPGMTEQLKLQPESAVTVLGPDDVETMYYLGAAWGLAISLGLDQPALAADFPAVRALLGRALELDEGYNQGAVHGALITLESLPEVMGGSPERARHHFERAVELSRGLDASPYVTLASGVSVEAQDREEFETLLTTALAVDVNDDPDNRLLNIIARRQAQLLLEHADDLFFEPLPDDEEESLR